MHAETWMEIGRIDFFYLIVTYSELKNILQKDSKHL